MLWSSLATKDARLAVQSLRRMATIPAETAWATYVRCHDDIGWAVSDTDAWAVGWSPFAHRHFLNDFYSGALPDVATPAARCSRTTRRPATPASPARPPPCAGSARPGARRRRRAGRRDPPARAAARRDVRLGRGAAALHGRRARARQRRELPRRPGARPGQPVDAPAVVRRRRGRPPDDPGSVEGRVFGWIQRLARVRASCPRCTRRGSRTCSGRRRPARPRAGAAGTRAAATSSGWSTSPSTRCRWTSACSTGWASWRPCCRRTATSWSRTAGELPGLGFAWLAEA